MKNRGEIFDRAMAIFRGFLLGSTLLLLLAPQESWAIGLYSAQAYENLDIPECRNALDAIFDPSRLEAHGFDLQKIYFKYRIGSNEEGKMWPIDLVTTYDSTTIFTINFKPTPFRMRTESGYESLKPVILPNGERLRTHGKGFGMMGLLLAAYLVHVYHDYHFTSDSVGQPGTMDMMVSPEALRLWLRLKKMGYSDIESSALPPEKWYPGRGVTYAMKNDLFDSEKYRPLLEFVDGKIEVEVLEAGKKE